MATVCKRAGLYRSRLSAVWHKDTESSVKFGSAISTGAVLVAQAARVLLLELYY